MKTHNYRISEAAMGRMYAEIIKLTRGSEIMPHQFHDMVFAVFNYIESGTLPPQDAKLNLIIWERLRNKIDKSARLSAAARARAAKRKEEKAQGLIAAAAKPVADLLAEATNNPSLSQFSDLKELLPYLTPENQKELLRIEQQKVDYVKEQEQKRIAEAKAEERRKAEELARKEKEWDDFVNWQLDGCPPTDRHFRIL